MNHTEEQHIRIAEPEPEVDSMPVVSVEQPSTPASDDLPAWLKPGGAAPVNPEPVGRWGRPLYAWGGTLTATALMVAFGLWLGGGQVTPEQKVAVALPVPASLPAPAPKAPVPPLVLLDAAAPAEPAAAPVIAPATARKVRAQGRAAQAPKKQLAAKRRSTTLAARTQARPRASGRSPMSEGWNNRVASADAGAMPRMRCKRGELARECLARYQ